MIGRVLEEKGCDMASRLFVSFSESGELVRPYAHDVIRCPGRVSAGYGDNICNGIMQFVDDIPYTNPPMARVRCPVCGVTGTVPVAREVLCQR